MVMRAGRSSLRRWIYAFGATALLALAIVAGVLWWALRDVPWDEIINGSMIVPTEEQAADAPLDAFPQHLIDAVLSVEDRRFYSHPGVDPVGITRAFLSNVSAGEVVQGGSTITQQLIKVLYLDRDRTYRRKIQEFVIAFWLEAKLGKDEILARYLNNIYLGAGATGVPAAARVFFSEDASALSLTQSAMIAGAIRAPSILNPIDNPQGSRQRARIVLAAMVDNGKLTPEEADRAMVELMP